MRMSATSRSRTSAYSLIEVLAILSLIAMVAAIAVPRFESLVDSVRFETNIKALSAAVRDARLSAYMSRRDITLEEYFEGVELPSGWTVRFPDSVVVTSRGVCLGGEMLIETASRSLSWRLDAPRCEPSEDEGT